MIGFTSLLVLMLTVFKCSGIIGFLLCTNILALVLGYGVIVFDSDVWLQKEESKEENKDVLNSPEYIKLKENLKNAKINMFSRERTKKRSENYQYSWIIWAVTFYFMMLYGMQFCSILVLVVLFHEHLFFEKFKEESKKYENLSSS